MYTIHLKNLILYGKHGIYPQEQLQATPFLLNISCKIAAGELQQLSDTVDYEKLFILVNEIFKTPYPLLESLAKDLVIQIKTAYPQVTNVQLSVFKTNPAIVGFQGTVGVSLEG